MNMETYIKYEQNGTITTDDMTGCELDHVLHTAAKMYAFGDFTETTVLEVVHEGKQYMYDGWEPGMVFTFRNESGEAVWSGQFPEWDH